MENRKITLSIVKIFFLIFSSISRQFDNFQSHDGLSSLKFFIAFASQAFHVQSESNLNEIDEPRNIEENFVDFYEENLKIQLNYLKNRIFGLPDSRTGQLVARWNATDKGNPEELGNYAEGDILYPLTMGRHAVRVQSARWARGVVPYVISPLFSEWIKSIYLMSVHYKTLRLLGFRYNSNF